MGDIDRRALLGSIAVGLVAAISGAPASTAVPIGWKIPLGRIPPPAGVLARLPGDGNQLALTVDDGASVPVVGAFAQFCRDTGTRLTFFVNGANPSWSANAPALRPMVDSGQVQMANHTWSHPYLNRMSLTAAADQIRRNADFLRNTYGADGTPFFRPPYGAHNADIDRGPPTRGTPRSPCGAQHSAIRRRRTTPAWSPMPRSRFCRNRLCSATPICPPSPTATTG